MLLDADQRSLLQAKIQTTLHHQSMHLLETTTCCARALSQAPWRAWKSVLRLHHRELHTTHDQLCSIFEAAETSIMCVATQPLQSCPSWECYKTCVIPQVLHEESSMLCKA